MIDRALLDKVTVIVTHKNPDSPCPDGVASAILLRDAFDAGVGVKFVAHNTPAYDTLEAVPGMLFCDIVPPPARTQEFIDLGAIVLDHHEKQKPIVDRYIAAGLGRYSDEPGVSGAVLAFREVWMHCTTPGSDSYNRASSFARLAGIRDTWQKNDPRWQMACEQAEALRFYPWKVFDEMLKKGGAFTMGGSERLSQLLDVVGPMLYEQRLESAKNHARTAFGALTDRGTRLMIVGTVETSDIAEAAGDQADVLIGFRYRADLGKAVLQLSARARGDYDVGAFCASLGGGGHRAAAGATIPVTNGDLNPFQTITKLLVDHER